jgi:hypothetical protein
VEGEEVMEGRNQEKQIGFHKGRRAMDLQREGQRTEGAESLGMMQGCSW